MKKSVSLIFALLGPTIAAAAWMFNGDLPKPLVASMFLLALSVTLVAIGFFIHFLNLENNADTQRIVTDLALLRLFEQQPGGLLSAAMVAEKTGLSKGKASLRLTALAGGGLLSAGTNANGMTAIYELSAPLEAVTDITLSGKPFLTVEDLQQIFVAYDYRVSPHDLMVTTDLPWAILSREMEHFRKNDIIEVAQIERPGDSSKQYILLEAYHPSDKMDLNSRTLINEEIKQLLYDERFLV